MTPESKNLLSQFARALSNEIIYGEGDNISMKRWRECGAKTTAARQALEAHIEMLESQQAQNSAKGSEDAN